MNLVKPRKCSYGRCTDGIVRLVSGAHVDCQRCTGTGFIEGDEATLAAQRQLREDIAAAHAKVEAEATRRGHKGDGFAVKFGFRLLEENDLDRFKVAVASVNARHPAVFDALDAYAVANGYTN